MNEQPVILEERWRVTLINTNGDEILVANMPTLEGALEEMQRDREFTFRQGLTFRIYKEETRRIFWKEY